MSSNSVWAEKLSPFQASLFFCTFWNRHRTSGTLVWNGLSEIFSSIEAQIDFYIPLQCFPVFKAANRGALFSKKLQHRCSVLKFSIFFRTPILKSLCKWLFLSNLRNVRKLSWISHVIRSFSFLVGFFFFILAYFNILQP